MKKNRSSFTLIELLLALSITVIIGTFTTGFYSRFIMNHALANAQDLLVTQLRKAHTYAVTGKRNSSWGVHVASGNITMFSGNSYSGRNSSFDELSTYNSNITVSGMTEIVFFKTTGFTSQTYSITLTGWTGTNSITVNPYGIITYL